MSRAVPSRSAGAGDRERPLFVATDIDGTLLDSSEHVPAAHREALAAAAQGGATVCLATGRPPRWIPAILDELGQSPLAVCANGSVLLETSTGEILWSELLEPDVLDELARIIHSALPGAGLAAERVGADAIDDDFVASPDYEHAWIQPESVEVGHAEVVERPVFKLLARVPGMSSADMSAAVRDSVAHLATVTYSTENGLIEFAPPGISKATTLARLANRLGAVRFERAAGEPPRTVAFGDMPNDVDMLRWADLGVAMGNAHPAAVEAADEVTLSSDEGGIAEVLRRWF